MHGRAPNSLPPPLKLKRNHWYDFKSNKPSVNYLQIIAHGILLFTYNSSLLFTGQIAQELEANLAQIEEVTEYIMISHSEALISLHCFKNLKRIGGSVLHQNK
jgi:hypothetical protein